MKKLGRIQGGAGQRVRGGTHSHYNRTFTDLDRRQRNTVGWECVQIAIDELLPPDLRRSSLTRGPAPVTGFLRRAVAFYAWVRCRLAPSWESPSSS